MKKRLLSILLCLTMVTGLLPTAFAGVVRDEDNKISYKPAEQGTYSNGGYTIDKVSHPTLGAGGIDGILTGKDQDRSNNYSWSMADGGKDSDYIYIGTCSNSTYHQYHLSVQTTLDGMVKKGDLPAGTDTKEMAAKIVRTVFGVDTFDETYATDWDPVIISVNKKTYEAQIVFHESEIRKDHPDIFVGFNENTRGMNVLAGYRMACRFHDKLYFVSMGQPTTTLVEVNPTTNKAQIVYHNSRSTPGVASGVHGLIVYDDQILMCLATDKYDEKGLPGGIIVASSDPSANLNNWRVIADQEDFDDLPAVMKTDGLNGGGIWDIIEYNGHLYVTVVTDKNIDGKINKQGFAMYRGDKVGQEFKWTQIIGAKDGSKYGYGLGIDHSMSCNLWVYNGYLYMGTYNDPMLDLAEVPATGNFELLYNDLDHSIYLYRMDENENFQQVGGKNDNPYFPNGPIGNLGAGLGNNSNQYVWRMGVHNGEFYIGTYDTATLTYKFTQITDGQLRDMKYDDLRGRADQLQGALQSALGKYGDNVLLQWFLNKTAFSDYTLKLVQKLSGFVTDMSADKNPVPDYRQMLSDYADFKDKVYDRLDGLRVIDAISFAVENPEATAQLLAEDVSAASISAMSMQDKLNFVNTMKERIRAMLDEIFKGCDAIVYDETIHNFVYYFGCNYYSQKSEPGFDLLVSNDGVNFDTITSDGFGDPANHGLRCITSTEEGVFLGTANPYYGTQLWRMHSAADEQIPADPKAPKAPEATEILTSYNVRCVTENSGHESKMMDPLPGTLTIGKVTKAGDKYVCPITISTNAYAAAYSTAVNEEHSAVQANITYNMTWDGIKWLDPEKNPTIDVTCTTSPEAPKAPEANEILTSYIVHCTTDKNHADKSMEPIDNTLTIGKVTKAGDKYVCPITISTKAYAEAYSTDVGKEHSAVQANITYNMTWDGIKWLDPEKNPTINVKCPTSTSGGGHSGGGSSHSSSSTYSITVKNSDNGTVISSHNTAKSGTPITLTAAPEKNYVLDTLKAVDSKNKEIKLTAKDGKYTFSMPSSNVTVTATFKKNFTDVPNGSYFEEAVDWAVKKGITTGTSAALFNPDGICTRAQAVTFLWRAAGSPAPQSSAMPFTDVPAGSYYYDAVLWAVENNITKGTSATTFHPDMNCSRAQIVTFLWRSQKSPSADSANPFADVASSAYYADAVLWAVKEDVTKGTSDTKFSPDANCTRAQIVTFIWRALSE